MDRQQELIEQASEKLADTVRDTVALLGLDVTQALIIHHLHEVSLAAERARQSAEHVA